MVSACSSGPPPTEEPPAEPAEVRREGAGEAIRGAAVFVRAGCDGCHTLDEPDTGPPLRKLWGSEVRSIDGRTIRVEGDAGVTLIVESMRAPNAFLLIGFPPLMPRYAPAELPDRDVAAIVAALRCLAEPAGPDCAGVAEAFAGGA